MFAVLPSTMEIEVETSVYNRLKSEILDEVYEELKPRFNLETRSDQV